MRERDIYLLFHLFICIYLLVIVCALTRNPTCLLGVSGVML